MPPGPGNSVFLAVPCLGEVRWETALAIQKMAARYGGALEVCYLSNVPIEMARDVLASRFLATAHPNLLFLDADIRPPDGFLDLVDRKLPVVAGWCPVMTRDFELYPNLFRRKEGGGYQPCWEESEGLIEVDAVGMGCTLIRREVFERLKRPWFAFEPDPKDGERWTGEDMSFCRKVQEAGFRIHAAPAMKCGHMKTLDLLALYQGSRRTP